MKLGIGGCHEIRLIDPKTGKVVKKVTNNRDLITRNLINIVDALFKGGYLTLTDVNGVKYDFTKVYFNQNSSLAGSGETKYGIILASDGNVTVNDYKLNNPLTGSNFSYGACSAYENQCSSDGWCRQLGVERKITYLGAEEINVSCIGLISKISGVTTDGSNESSYFLLIKDKTGLSIPPGYVADVKVYVTLNPS